MSSGLVRMFLGSTSTLRRVGRRAWNGPLQNFLEEGMFRRHAEMHMIITW